MASFVDLFDQPSFDPRWTIANATLDTVNDKALLSTGTLGTGAGGLLQSEWDSLDFTYVPEIVDLYSSGSVSLYITSDGLINGRGARILLDKQSAGGGTDRLLLGFIANDFDSVVVTNTISTNDFSPNPTIRVQRSNTGLWTISVNGVAVITNQAEPAAITADGNMQAGILFSTGAANSGAIHSTELVGDIVAPSLTTPTAAATGATTASGSVSTNESTGELVYLASQNATELASTVVANGLAQAVTATGVQNVTVSGLLGLQNYYIHYVHIDESLNQSTVSSSAQFTTEAYTREIIDIDGDNIVEAGQASVAIKTTGLNANPAVKTVTLGGQALTVVSWIDNAGIQTITVNISLHTLLQWGATHTLVVADDTGSVTFATPVQLIKPALWETITLATLPDEANTDSFYELSKTDADTGNFTAVVGDVLAIESKPGLTVNSSTIPTVEPPATLTGGYKWWDTSLGVWTSVSSYTVSDLGFSDPPALLVSIDSIEASRTSAIVTLSYPGTDLTGMQYNIGAGWLTAVSPLTLSGLSEGTTYTFQARATNDGVPGDISTTTFTTQAAVDTTPNAFSFTELTNQPINTQVVFPYMTVLGVDAGVDVPVSVENGTYSVSTDGGQTWGAETSSPTNVRLNYRVRPHHVTAATHNTSKSTELIVGGVSALATSATGTGISENAENTAPTQLYVRVGTPYEFSQHVTNPNNLALNYALAQSSPALPAGVTLNASTGTLTATTDQYTPVNGMSIEVTLA